MELIFILMGTAFFYVYLDLMQTNQTNKQIIKGTICFSIMLFMNVALILDLNVFFENLELLEAGILKGTSRKTEIIRLIINLIVDIMPIYILFVMFGIIETKKETKGGKDGKN